MILICENLYFAIFLFAQSISFSTVRELTIVLYHRTRLLWPGAVAHAADTSK